MPEAPGGVACRRSAIVSSVSASCVAPPAGSPRVLGWLIGLSLLSSPLAIAHPQFGPATVNRYARLVFTAPTGPACFTR